MRMNGLPMILISAIIVLFQCRQIMDLPGYLNVLQAVLFLAAQAMYPLITVMIRSFLNIAWTAVLLFNSGMCAAERSGRVLHHGLRGCAACVERRGRDTDASDEDARRAFIAAAMCQSCGVKRIAKELLQRTDRNH